MHPLTRLLILPPVAAACLFLAPHTAHASDSFPAVVQQAWQFKHPLPVSGSKGCRLCHTDEFGGEQNVTTRFGRMLKDKYRVTKKSNDGLRSALTDIRTKRTDTDADGITDYDEVAIDETDPNDPRDRRPLEPIGQGGADGAGGENGEFIPEPIPSAPLEDLPPPLGHGCTLTAGSARLDGSMLAAFLLGLAALFGHRRRA